MTDDERENMIELLTIMTGYSSNYWKKQTDQKLEKEFEKRLGE